MQKLVGIFLSKIVYRLNFYTVPCYFNEMKQAGRFPLRAFRAFYPRIGHRGQTLVEYALILAIISIVAIGVLINMGGQVKGVYSRIDSEVAIAPSGSH